MAWQTCLGKCSLLGEWWDWGLVWLLCHAAKPETGMSKECQPISHNINFQYPVHLEEVKYSQLALHNGTIHGSLRCQWAVHCC